MSNNTGVLWEDTFSEIGYLTSIINMQPVIGGRNFIFIEKGGNIIKIIYSWGESI